MEKKKRYIKQASIIIGFVLLNLMIISIISKTYYEFNSGADRNNSIHIDLKHNDYYLPKITINTANAKGRVLNPEVLKNIEKDYLNAWYVKSYALLHNDQDSYQDFYTDSAQVKLKEMIDYNYKNNISIDMTSIKHHLEVEFFSEDGQLIFLKDKNVEEVVTINEKGKTLHSEYLYSDYDVVLLLEDGFWRVRHIIKTNHIPRPSLLKDITKKHIPNTSIKGINYYPQNTPWLEFWNKYDKKVVNNDFKIIKNLGLNTVRVFIPYDDFGKANASTQKIEHLKTTLNLAEENQLKLIITFFDFYNNYSVSDYSLCDRHLEQIISSIKNHNAILQYDIKNEPDLDFKNHKKEKVLNWLDFISNKIKQYDSLTPITIGWSDIKYAQLLEDKIDVISFHYYKKASLFSKEYTALKMKTKKPVVLQEFGKHSYNSFWFPFSNTQTRQAIYYQEMQEQFQNVSLNSFVSWTLYDFPKIDNSIFGKLPHKINPQKNYGIIDLDGNKKEVAVFLTQPNASIKYSIVNYFNQFHFSLFLIIAFSIFIITYRIKRK